MAGATAEFAAGRIGPPGWATTFTSWGGTWAQFGIIPELDPWPGRLLAVAMVGLAAAFAVAFCAAMRGDLGPRAVVRLGAVWSIPFVIGPPMLSNDVYSYVAQGAVASSGADPTRVSPWSLGFASPLLRAVDPMWRDTESPYGPLATALQRSVFEASSPHPVLAVLAWRLLAWGALAIVSATSLALARRAGPVAPERGATVLLLTWANPLLLLHLVAAAHVDAAMLALLSLALWAAATMPRWGRPVAVVLATSAAAIKVPAIAAVMVLALAPSGTLTTRARRLGLMAALAVVVWAAWSWVAGTGGNFLAVFTTPGEGRTLVAPSTALADLIAPLTAGGSGTGSVLLTGCRVAVGLVGVGLAAALVVTADRRPAATTVGAVMLIAALAAPVLYPWYLAWSVPLLAIHARGRTIRRLALLSALGSVMTIQGLTRVSTFVASALVITAAVVWLVQIEGWTRRPWEWLRAARTDRATSTVS